MSLAAFLIVLLMFAPENQSFKNYICCLFAQ
jgi:hypothetical protein